jgi:hypothetical protein
MESQELAQVESRIRRAYNGDGMIETLLGLAFIGGGINLLTRSAGGMVFVVIIVAIASSWRRKITYPRLGYARAFDTRTRRRGVVVTVLLALAVLLVATVGFGLHTDQGTSWVDTHARLLFGGFLCCAVAAAGVARKATHLYLVAAVLFGLIVVADRLNVTAGYPIVFMGCVLIAAGLIRLVLFLRSNPIVPETADLI